MVQTLFTVFAENLPLKIDNNLFVHVLTLHFCYGMCVFKENEKKENNRDQFECLVFRVFGILSFHCTVQI